MKKLTTYFFGAAIIAASFTGCKKDDGGTQTFSATQGKITGTGSVSFDVSGASSSFNRQVTSGSTAISITGIISSSPIKSIIIQFINVTAPGTYSLAQTPSNFSAQITYVGGLASNDSYISSLSSTGNGSVTITSISTTSIEGTYTTKATNLAGTSITFSGIFKGNF